MKDIEKAGTPWERVKIEAPKRRNHNLQTGYQPTEAKRKAEHPRMG